jgi:hypothetical protein
MSNKQCAMTLGDERYYRAGRRLLRAAGITRPTPGMPGAASS